MKEFYGWDSKAVGFTIFASTVFAVPIALSVAPLSKVMQDRQILWWSLLLYLLGTVLKINFKVDKAPNLYLYLTASGI